MKIFILLLFTLAMLAYAAFITMRTITPKLRVNTH